MRSLNVTRTTALVPTPALPLGGVIVGDGATRSAPAPVVKDRVTVPIIAIPLVSRTPAIEIVYGVFGDSRPSGDSVIVWFAELRLGVVGTSVWPGASNWTESTLPAWIGSLKNTWTTLLIGVFVKVFGGLVPTTVGGVASPVNAVTKLM